MIEAIISPGDRREFVQGSSELKTGDGEVAELSDALAKLMLGADAPRPDTDQL